MMIQNRDVSTILCSDGVLYNSSEIDAEYNIPAHKPRKL